MLTLRVILVLRRKTTLMSLLLILTIGDFKGNYYTYALKRTSMTIVPISSIGISK